MLIWRGHTPRHQHPLRSSPHRPAGFGQLHPRTQGVTTLGTIYASSLFPGRVPEGKVLLLSYFGGATNTRVATMPHGEIVSQVKRLGVVSWTAMELHSHRSLMGPTTSGSLEAGGMPTPAHENHLSAPCHPTASQVDKDLRKMLIRSDAESPHTVNVTVWPRAIPQFNVGHTDLIQVCKSFGRKWHGSFPLQRGPSLQRCESWRQSTACTAACQG